MENEIWKELPKSLKLSNYLVSNIARSKNIKTGRINDSKDRKANNWGYKLVKLTSDDGKEKNYPIHLLMAHAFLKKPEGNVTVDHINKVRDDNRLENLRWATASEQSKNKNKVVVKFSRKVLQYDLENNLIKEWTGIPEIVKELNLKDKRSIYAACTKNKKYMDHYWKFKDSIPLEGEEWKDTTVNKKKIKVSNYGRFMTNVKTGVIIDSSHLRNKKHYLRVSINKKLYYAQRLVMLAFKDIPYDDDRIINHIDGNYHNNRLENLEAITYQENTIHAVKIGSFAKTNIINSKKVARLDKDDNVDKIYDSITAAAAENNIDNSMISMVCKGKRKTTGGFKWKYV